MRIHDFDEALRKIFSVIFRFIIIFFATFVLWTSQNQFEPYIYILGSILYFGVYVLVFKKKRYLIRLFLDYGYIFFIVYGKTITNPAAALIILLPLINSPNHSGKASSPIRVVMLTFSLFLYLNRESSVLDSHKGYLAVYILIPFVLMVIIVGFELIRTYFIRLNDKFSYEIDKYYESNIVNLAKPRKILRTILSLMNETNLVLFKTHKVICYKIIGSRLVIMGSTKFVLQYSIHDLPNFIANLEKQKVVRNWPITVDEVKHKYSASLLVKSSSFNYVFVLLTNSTPGLTLSIVQPVFVRMAKVWSFEDHLSDQKRKSSERFKNKIQFIEQAKMAMHFIKNKITPISNFIAISEDEEKLSEHERVKARELFIKERAKIKHALPLIIEKAQKFHENTDVPFSLSDYIKCSPLKLVAIARSNWSTYFADEEIFTQLDVSAIDTYQIEMNEDLFEFLMTNWISNVSKHHAGKRNLQILETQISINLVFINNFHVRDRGQDRNIR